MAEVCACVWGREEFVKVRNVEARRVNREMMPFLH